MFSPECALIQIQSVLYRALVFLAVLTASSLPAAAGLADWAPTGEIHYDVMRGENGLKLGEALHRWKHDGERYHMQTEVETTGLAGLLYSFRYVQTSEGSIVNGGLQPKRFRVEQSGRDIEQASFDWADKEVLIERSRGRSATHALEVGDQDVLSVWHLVALEGVDALRGELSLVTNRRVSEADVTVVGRESLRLPMGEVAAVRVTARARSGALKIDMWLSEQHDLLPVRILMEDDNGEVLDQQATRLSRGS